MNLNTAILLNSLFILAAVTLIVIFAPGAWKWMAFLSVLGSISIQSQPMNPAMNRSK